MRSRLLATEFGDKIALESARLGPVGEKSALNIAIIGAGISGMSCAWMLSSSHSVTVYERDDYIGGHSNTVEVNDRDSVIGIDTGFIVYNEVTYPNLTALFHHLGVETQPSDMSFAVSLDEGRLEYAAPDLNGLFAQRGNLLRPRFWGMLCDIRRFYREAPRDLPRLEEESVPLATYLRDRGYGTAFCEEHLFPMAASIWSCPPAAVGRYPAAAFIRFCDNHGLLQVSVGPMWRTVRGGSQAYVRHLTKTFSDQIRTNCPVLAVERLQGKVRVHSAAGAFDYDRVVLACHADQSLALLGEGATRQEQAILGAFSYTKNLAVLHTDDTMMPKRRHAWSSWNYLGRSDDFNKCSRPCLTYWMNRLQRLASSKQYFVTLNPPQPPRPGMLLHTESYEHPVFDDPAMRARGQLWSLQNVGGVWFCGAHFGAGFHEDGLQAGLAVGEQLGKLKRPWDVVEAWSRIDPRALVGWQDRAEGKM